MDNQEAIKWLREAEILDLASGNTKDREAVNMAISALQEQLEPHYCRECKWSRCHINVDKYGNTETYWHCLNWDGGTDEEGYCHEWKRKDEGFD